MSLLRHPVLSNTAIQLIGKVINTATTLLVTLLLTRFLGASFYGDFTKVFTTVTLLYMALDFGFNAITVRRLGRHPNSVASEISTLITLRLAYAFILFIFLCLFLALTPTPAVTGYTFPVKLSVFIFGFSLFTQAIFTSVNALFQHHTNYLPQALSAVSANLITLIAVALALIFSPHLITIALAHLVGSLVLATTNLLFLALDTKANLRFTLSGWRQLALETLPLGVMILLNTAMVRFDSLLLTLTRPTLEVGWYGLAYRIFEDILVLPLFFINALYPIMIQRHQASPFHLRRLILHTGQFLLPASVFFTLTFFFASPLIPLVFGPSMSPAIAALKLLGLSFPAFFLTVLLQWTLITLHQEQVLIKVYALGLLVNVIANLWFIPRLGFLAAAVTTGLTEIIVFSLLLLPVLQFFKTVKGDYAV